MRLGKDPDPDLRDVVKLQAVRSNYGRLALRAHTRNGSVRLIGDSVLVDPNDNVKEFKTFNELTGFVFDELGKLGLAMITNPEEIWTHIHIPEHKDETKQDS